MANNFDKFAILESFLDEVHSYLPEIESGLDRLQQRPDDMETIEETYRRVHTIAGSSAMMDYKALSHVAQNMEALLGDVIDQQSTLDSPSIALLRRSFGRLSRLMDNIRSGADNAPILAEDDADRAAWRGAGPQSPIAQGTMQSEYSSGALHTNGAHEFAGGQNGVISPAAAVSPSPSVEIPDWLAAFASPSAGESAKGASGVDITHTSQAQTTDALTPPEAHADASIQSESQAADTMAWGRSITDLPTNYGPAYAPSQPESAEISNDERNPFEAYSGSQPSLDEMLQSFQTNAYQGNSYDIAEQSAPSTPEIPTRPDLSQSSSWERSTPYSTNGFESFDTVASAPSYPQQPSRSYPANTGQQATNSSVALPTTGSSVALPAQVEELRANANAFQRQMSSLSGVAESLREAAQAMEDERMELRTFLDGSRDALDRLEEWSGQQMGLDLSHSPESVRRYLPLSVIWVTTTRLKQLVALLNNSNRGLTAKQEEIEETFGELLGAINQLEQNYQSGTSFQGEPAAGFTATVAQITWAPPVRPAEPQTDRWRESSVQSFATSQTLSPGARAETERHVREQLRRELEDEVRAEIAAEVRRDEEERLRQELQIQVRRQLLSELTPGMGTPALPESAVQVGEFMPFAASHTPQAVRVTSEQSPEALEVFSDEAQEHLQTITTGLAQLEAAPGDRDVLQSIRRAMHTLKGAAGMMGFTAIQHLAHASEDLLDRLMDGAITFTSETLSLLLDTSEGLDRLVRDANATPEEQNHILQSLGARYSSITGSEMPELAGDFAESDSSRITVLEETEEVGEAQAPSTDLSVRLQLSKLDDLVNLFGELLINRSVLEERIERLNRFVSDTSLVSERLRDVGGQLETRFEAATLPSGRANNVLASNGQERDATLNRVAGLQRGGSTGGLRPGSQEFTSGFDELELDRYTEFHRLSRGLSEGVADVITLSHEMESLIRECQASFLRENRLSSDFQDRLLKARLVPLQSLMPRLYRVARASALKEGKEIEFFTEGAETEVDRKVFEEVAGPLLHLVRNAVNHGMETPDARERAGKPRSGKVLVAATYEGNQVVISVRDDGAGIDPEHIRSVAIARGWIDAYTPLSEREAINLIFQQGVTTAETVTEESGRGVGLDVVRDTVARLRGTIEVDSTPGQGSIFTMKFPISLQIARAVLVKVGAQTLAIPMALVEQIGRLDYYRRTSDSPPAIELHGERYPLIHLGSYLRAAVGHVDERSSVLLINAGKRHVALLVDSIISQQEIVLKPLGPHLREVRGVAGAAVLGNGQVVLILELLELLSQQPREQVILPDMAAHSAVTQAPTDRMPVVSASQAAPPAPSWRGAHSAPSVPTTAARSQQAAAPPQSAPVREFVVAPRPQTAPSQGNTSQHHVVASHADQRPSYLLVVDDSPSVRRVVSNMLKANRWEVQTARDGIEALEVVARQTPAAVLLDIEMPRMDGYELMATIRSQEQYRNLPLIVLTSRAATKHQQRALQLGADAYVVKPYQDEELLNTIATLVQSKR